MFVRQLLDLAEHHAGRAVVGEDSYAEVLIGPDVPGGGDERQIEVRFPRRFAGIAA